MRVVNERVLPKDMYFSRITSWNTQAGLFDVDWKDLTLRGSLATVEESKAIVEKYGAASGPIRVDGFNYRIRARFVSSGPPIAKGTKRTPGIKPEDRPNTAPR